MRYETKGKRNIDLGYNIPNDKTLQITDNNGETPQFMLLGGRKIHLTSKPAEYIDVELVDSPTRVANNSILHSATAFDVGQEVNAIIEKQNAIKKAFAEILVFKNEIDNKLAEHELLIDGQLSELGQKQELNKQETDGSLIELSNGIKLNTGDIQNIYNLISELNQKAFDTDAELKDVVSVLNKHEHPKVTKESIGLGKADNTSDIEKPISKATQEALNTKASIDDLNELVEKITKLQKKQKDFQRGIDSLGGMGISTVNLEGGKKGQILRKKSNQDGDYYWADAQDIHSIEFSIVENLPENGKPYIVYLVPVDDPQTKNVYEEYVWVEKQSGTYDYEKLGTTEVDLSPYRKASDQDTIDAGKVDKVTTARKVYGTDASGNQTTYDKDSFGQVDDVKVNGTSVVSNKVASITVPTQPSDIGAATSAQGALADTAVQPNDNISELNNDVGYITKDVNDLTNYTLTSSFGSAAFTPSSDYATSAQGALADSALQPNSPITGATKCKITYDSNGLVTAGSDLEANDIPSLTISKISDITATASELNVLDGITASTTELNYLDGVTSSIQTQLNGKQPTGNYMTTDTVQSVGAGATKTFNGRVNFIGEGDSKAIYLSTDTRIDVYGTSRTVLGFASGTFLINNAAYPLNLRGSGARPAWNGTSYLALTSDIGNATLTIQKNGTAVDTFTANATSDKTINITVPTQASDVNALPDSTKYGASLSLSINSSTYVVTAQLKDQDGNALGSAQTIDLPLESVVVSGSYDDATKKIILTLQSGSTIEFSVADLVSGLQTEITSNNMLDADLVDDSTSTNKFVTSSDITSWNGKVSDVEVNGSSVVSGGVASVTVPTDTSDLTNGAGYITGISSSDVTTALGYTPYDDSNPDGYITGITSSDVTTALGYSPVNPTALANVATSGSYNDLSNKPTIPTVNNPTITITQGGVTKGSFTLNQSTGDTIDLDAGGGNVNTFNLFDHKWSDYQLNDQSWLRADTFSWQDGTVYSDAYSHLVADYNGGTSTTETVGSYTITYVLATDGHKITTDETNVANIYNESGVAWYYILDTTNQRFKLPRELPITDKSKGNGITLGLTDGSRGFGLQGGSGKDWNNDLYTTGTYGNPVNTGASGTASTTNNSLGITTDQTKSGIISHRANENGQQYLYFYVGQFSQTATEQTAGLNAELFNGKMDLDLGNATQTTKETIVGLCMPDYDSAYVIAGSTVAQQAPVNLILQWFSPYTSSKLLIASTEVTCNTTDPTTMDLITAGGAINQGTWEGSWGQSICPKGCWFRWNELGNGARIVAIPLKGTQNA